MGKSKQDHTALLFWGVDGGGEFADYIMSRSQWNDSALRKGCGAREREREEGEQ